MSYVFLWQSKCDFKHDFLKTNEQALRKCLENVIYVSELNSEGSSNN